MSNEPKYQYPFQQIEPKWQRFWDENQTYRAPNPGDPDFDPSKPKYYVLDMFPYPSGDGLHVGHPEGYTATDIVARHKRRNGYNVLHPMGWDAFGLPAENYAIKTGQHPRITTENNIARFKEQLKAIGFSYDWNREVNTTDPGYFKWTQWIFLQLYNSYFDKEQNKARPISELEAKGLSREEIDARRLAFVSDAPVNWCPALGTVLANEEVVDGRSEVGGHPVERRPLRQWKLRITEYAQRLIDELEDLDWPGGIKKRQVDWIGRSDGANVDFELPEIGERLTVFTTRPDTLFGATYMVLAPEHELVEEITSGEQRDAVQAYCKEVATKSDRDREEAKEKTGVFTGGYAINPVNNERIPIWIADYVLISYGTGAIMAVPAHDERDFEFAEKFSLPIIQVVAPPDEGIDWRGFTGHGTAVNSSELLDGLPTPEAKAKITGWLEEQGRGEQAINYKLRDWLFARQRYWGEPFPIVWEDGQHRPIGEDELPVVAPEMDDYKPSGGTDAPLAKAEDWVRYSETETRETITMPQWAGSCWYYLRFCDAQNPDRFVGEEAEKYWMGEHGVDLYVGGTEHAVLHLLYARFWHKLLFDLGHVSTREPFHRLVNQGMILGAVEITGYRDGDGGWVSAQHAKEGDDGKVRHAETGAELQSVKIEPNDAQKAKGDNFVLVSDPQIRLTSRAHKMSKSRGNVVNPDDVIATYGADSLRLYEMFMGPLEQVKPWSTTGVDGVYRFLGRVWRVVMERDGEEWNVSEKVRDIPVDADVLKVVHQTIKKVSEDTEALAFNTAISQMMILANRLTQCDERPLEAVVTLLTVLNPYAPHITEELYSVLREKFADLPAGLLAEHPWPAFDESKLVEDEITIVVQVNGKKRDQLKVDANISDADLEQLALASDGAKSFTEGKTVRKVIVVPKKLVSIVAN